MRNSRTLVERMTLSKVIEGELHTIDIDLHQQDETFMVYVYDPNEAFAYEPFLYDDADTAQRMFANCSRLIMEEPVFPTESAFDFAERIYDMLQSFQ